MIGVINYGMGNIGSLENMIRKLGGEVLVSSDPRQLDKADRFILPGVGAFDTAMTALDRYGLIDFLNDRVLNGKTTILCICLGIQLITRSSEEGALPGFGWIKAKTVRFAFPPDSDLKIPHMGWNDVKVKKSSRLFSGMDEDPCFYFVHSYHLVCEDESDVLTTTKYGYEFVSAIETGNIFGTQFHPEKSHKYGLMLLSNFMGH